MLICFYPKSRDHTPWAPLRQPLLALYKHERLAVLARVSLSLSRLSRDASSALSLSLPALSIPPLSLCLRPLNLSAGSLSLSLSSASFGSARRLSAISLKVQQSTQKSQMNVCEQSSSPLQNITKYQERFKL